MPYITHIVFPENTTGGKWLKSLTFYAQLKRAVGDFIENRTKNLLTKESLETEIQRHKTVIVVSSKIHSIDSMWIDQDGIVTYLGQKFGRYDFVTKKFRRTYEKKKKHQ